MISRIYQAVVPLRYSPNLTVKHPNVSGTYAFVTTRGQVAGVLATDQPPDVSSLRPRSETPSNATVDPNKFIDGDAPGVLEPSIYSSANTTRFTPAQGNQTFLHLDDQLIIAEEVTDRLTRTPDTRSGSRVYPSTRSSSSVVLSTGPNGQPRPSPCLAQNASKSISHTPSLTAARQLFGAQCQASTTASTIHGQHAPLSILVPESALPSSERVVLLTATARSHIPPQLVRRFDEPSIQHASLRPTAS
ncbi:hypothetical protein RhiJN_09150 [Ceratobasidium sp. AG-Ba]|nr:hypothetical protein RhiJN_09150 [Ceratobasidium sp. AG-Ba]